MDFDLFVIGGGSAGVRCARIAAGHGARVGVAEERFWGGTCVNVGCVPKKLLVQAGEYGAWAEDAAGFGWTIKKGPHDWAKLIAAKDREIGRLNGIYKRLLDNAGATIFEARATFLDPHTLDVGGKRVTAETHRHRHRRPSGAPADPRRRTRHHLRRCVLPAAHAEARGDHRLGLHRGGVRRHLRRLSARDVDLVYRQPLPLRGFDMDLREVAGRGAWRAGHHAASRQPAAEARARTATSAC